MSELQHKLFYCFADICVACGNPTSDGDMLCSQCKAQLEKAERIFPGQKKCPEKRKNRIELYDRH